MVLPLRSTRERGHRGADIDDGDDAVLAQLEVLADEPVGALHRVGLDIHDLRRQVRAFDRLDTRIDGLAPAGGEQDLDHVIALRRGALDLEIQGDFLEGVGNVLVRLERQLRFHLVIGEARGHVDQLGDDRGTGHRCCHVLELGAGLGDHAADGAGDTVDIVDGFFDHGILRERAHGVTFYAVLVPRAAQFQQFHGRGTDIQPQQRRLPTFPEQPQQVVFLYVSQT
jgi:hypothetical protein